MSSTHKNNKPQKSFQPTKRYSTRQIMELTEKRRKQMDEEERLKLLLKAEPKSDAPETIEAKPTVEAKKSNTAIDTQTVEQPAAFDTAIRSPQDFSKPTEKSVVTDMPVEVPAQIARPPEAIVPDGKTVAGLFRPAAQNSTEEKVTQLITQEFNKAVEHISSRPVIIQSEVSPSAQARVPAPRVVLDFSFDSPKAVVPDAPRKEQKVSSSRPPIKKILSFALETIFYSSSFVLLALMMIHLLQVGWKEHFYDQSPFVFMMALTMFWLSRKNIVKRTHWFWGSAVIIAGGIGVFIAAALEGHSYIELASFLIVCFGLFLWRYQEECACRLFFPLISFLFIFAPPGNWEQVTITPLNECVYQISAWLINSLHISVHNDGQQFHVAGGAIYFAADPTTFRSITVAAVLAIACLSFQNLATTWSIVLFGSVIFWALLGNIVRVTLTGLMLENFGLEYASMFYSDYSVFVVMVILLAGITLTSGLLPHKEDFE